MSVKNLNSSNFDGEVIEIPGLAFVDFSATWCGPCKMYGPIFHEFAEQNVGKAVFGTIDIDESRDIAMRFGIQAVPTTLVFKGGQIVDSITGTADKRMLEDKLARHA